MCADKKYIDYNDERELVVELKRNFYRLLHHNNEYGVLCKKCAIKLIKIEYKELLLLGCCVPSNRRGLKVKY